MSPQYSGEIIYLSERLEKMVADYMRRFARRTASGYAEWIDGMDDYKVQAMILKERGEDITLDTVRRVRRKHVGKMRPGAHNLGATYRKRPRPEPPKMEAPPPPPPLPPPPALALDRAIWAPPPAHQQPGQAYANLIGLYVAIERQLATLDAKIETLDAKVDRLLDIWR